MSVPHKGWKLSGLLAEVDQTKSKADDKIREEQLLNFLVNALTGAFGVSFGENAEFKPEDIYEVLVGTTADGTSIPEAADREGRSAATGGRWADAWNEDGLEGLMPSFGGDWPPKLDENKQDELVEMLRDGQPWTSQEIQHLLQEEFGVSYSPNYLGNLVSRTRNHTAKASTSTRKPY